MLFIAKLSRFVVHVLFVAGIFYRYRITIDGVCIVPLSCVRHVVTLPSAESRPATWEG